MNEAQRVKELLAITDVGGYKLLSSKEQVLDFFEESLMWRDIQGLLRESLEEGRKALEEPGLDGEGLAMVRGGIANLRAMLDLPKVMAEMLDEEAEDMSEDGLEDETFEHYMGELE